jgi:iron transport multicopper oxidase
VLNIKDSEQILPHGKMRLSTLTLLFLRIVSASIGPTADLHIVNNNIQPDGFTRSYVLQHFSKFSYIKLFCYFNSAVLAGTSSTVGTFPGPLISGAKVGPSLFSGV